MYIFFMFNRLPFPFWLRCYSDKINFSFFFFKYIEIQAQRTIGTSEPAGIKRLHYVPLPLVQSLLRFLPRDTGWCSSNHRKERVANSGETLVVYCLHSQSKRNYPMLGVAKYSVYSIFVGSYQAGCMDGQSTTKSPVTS